MILETALKIAQELELESEKLGIYDRLQNIKKTLFRLPEEENQCHSERAKKPSRNEAVEHNPSLMDDLLQLLENDLMHLKEDEM